MAAGHTANMRLDCYEETRCGEGPDEEVESGDPDDDGLYYVLLMDMVPHRPLGEFSRAQLEPKLREFGVPWDPTGPIYIFEIPSEQCGRCRQWLHELGWRNITPTQRERPVGCA